MAGRAGTWVGTTTHLVRRGEDADGVRNDHDRVHLHDVSHRRHRDSDLQPRITSITRDALQARRGVPESSMRHVKAKFHYASWFGAGSKLVRTRLCNGIWL